MTATSTTDVAQPRWLNWGLWALQVLLAVGFLAAGSQKLLSTEPMVAMFAEIGFGQWFRWVTGLLEFAAAVLVVIPRTAALGAALMVCITLGAVLTHLVLIGGSPVPALVLLALAAIVAWGRRPARA
jgi:uncharacterized membrane protein YphA (DoxX/SURF4 family)